MLRFAANLTMMYTEYPFTDRFSAAARDGFQAVEYLFPYDYPAVRLASLLKSHNLQQVLINAPAGNWDAGERGLACLPGREAEFRTAMHCALEYAQALECPRVHVMAGIAPSDIERSALGATYICNLAWAAEQAAAVGRDVLIEPINPRDMPGYFLNRQEEAHAIAAEIDRPNFKVQMDLYHCAAVEGDVAMELRRYLGTPRRTVVGHIQIAGVPGRHEPDTGELNFDPLFDLIEQFDFQGWIGLEYRPKAGTSDGLKWLRSRTSDSRKAAL
jgi:hydroxypyruvate isomerase